MSSVLFQEIEYTSVALKYNWKFWNTFHITQKSLANFESEGVTGSFT